MLESNQKQPSDIEREAICRTKDEEFNRKFNELLEKAALDPEAYASPFINLLNEAVIKLENSKSDGNENI